MDNLNTKLQEAKAKHQVEHINVVYRRLFNSPDGKIVLDDLRKQFYDTVLTGSGATNLSVAVKAAQHDVVTVIIRNTKEHNNDI